jgi:hypothetical protein
MIVRFYNSFYKALDKIKDKTKQKRIESTIQKAELAQGQILNVGNFNKRNGHKRKKDTNNRD